MPILILVTIIFAPLIYFEDKGPIFYNSKRVGRNGKTFIMFKFRTMKVNSPNLKNEDGSTFNSPKDPRLTKIGRFMRSTSVDELPQFINILLGNMSLIGPRPNLATRSLSDYDPIRLQRIQVRPGITGYNQAYYRNSVDQNQKFLNDVYYVEHISIIFDIKILIKTVFSVLLRKNVYVSSKKASDYSEDHPIS
jgi:lipopolysaccharide/colanic/teichoic acid biosynthesis glycosyltransferase